MSLRPQRLIGKFLFTIFVLNCFSGFSPSLTTVPAQDGRVIIVNAERTGRSLTPPGSTE